jgi:hypothetical protein
MIKEKWLNFIQIVNMKSAAVIFKKTDVPLFEEGCGYLLSICGPYRMPVAKGGAAQRISHKSRALFIAAAELWS